MRMDIGIVRVAEKTRTTEFQLVGESPPMDNFFVNTERLSSLPFDTDKLVLSISDQPFAAGEVGLALPAIPFFKVHKNGVVQYRHPAERKGRGRRKPRPAPSTPDLPATLSYVKKSALEDEFVAARKPVYFGISPIIGDAIEDEPRATDGDIAAADETVRAALLEALDDFLRARFRPQRGARLTSQDVQDSFIDQEGANLSEDALNSLQLIDISRRVRAIFGITMVANPTRIKGRHQRYWDGYTV